MEGGGRGEGERERKGMIFIVTTSAELAITHSTHSINAVDLPTNH